MIHRILQRHHRRRGVSVVEMALIAPFLAFLFVIAIDFSRIFYFGLVLENCARNGAYYGSNYPNANYIYNDIYGYKNLAEAVTKDAPNMSPAPTYAISYSATLNGSFGSTALTSGYVKVTATWDFKTITQFPGVPGTVTLTRSVVMKMAPVMPDFVVSPPLGGASGGSSP